MYYESNELYHYGVKGMKWGVRKDKRLTKEEVLNLEKEAQRREYKRHRKNGGRFTFKTFRTSTGENYNKAENKFREDILNSKKYKELSKKAAEAEYKRIMAEKKFYIPEKDIYNDQAYNKYWNSTKSIKLAGDSFAATKAKNDYVEKKAKEYREVIKDAKIKDLNITKNVEESKKWLSGKFDDFVSDENLQYDADHFYDLDFEKEWSNKIKK